MAIISALHPIRGPQRAVRFVQSPGRASDRTPAILWLTVALIALWSLRNGTLPNVSQALTAAVAIGALVLLGSVVPRFVVWVLLALVVAAALGTSPQLIAFLDRVRTGGLFPDGWQPPKWGALP